ncbi:hypothetical protein DPEC_G00300280 [Dallia pectoralis]|uniref:Uncharacterized protein n=1 Tax=Dallia pectoralis TaxID=75939 RepID=A0ACC2FGF0_DALPE|nr:hypothetical protein DPEC_G00300280 [Dallia pectoralis]
MLSQSQGPQGWAASHGALLGIRFIYTGSPWHLLTILWILFRGDVPRGTCRERLQRTRWRKGKGAAQATGLGAEMGGDMPRKAPGTRCWKGMA